MKSVDVLENGSLKTSGPGTWTRTCTRHTCGSAASVLHSTLQQQPSRANPTGPRLYMSTFTMTTMYRPAEAIALLRPSLLLPRVQRCPHRLASAHRHAFSTTPSVQATHSSTSSPRPVPQRKSITLTGDTGQVRWSELSPGEKAVRTTQQSFHLGIVVVGIIATVCPAQPCNLMI